MTDQEAWQEAYARYDGDRAISDLTGEEETFDDWGYAKSERRAFLAGVEWQKERNPLTPEWEYALRGDGDTEPYSDVSEDLDWLLDGTIFEGTHTVRRTKAGPWEPVQ